MDERSKDPDLAVLDNISHSPPRRKAHSYSQQLRPKVDGNYKRNQHHPRKHSLDEIDIFSTPPRKNTLYDSRINLSDDDELRRFSGNFLGDLDNQNEGPPSREDGEAVEATPLPDFMGNGGGVGVFRVPTRAAVHPSRPPCVELRPHPLRETQVVFLILLHNFTILVISNFNLIE